MKSARSTQSSRPKRTLRVPAAGSSGLFTASHSCVSPSGMLSITSFTGSSTAMRRAAVRLSTSRTACSRMPTSVVEMNFVTPTPSQNARTASAG